MSMASILATETSAYNSVIALTLIPRVHGKPSRNQYKEALRAVIKNLDHSPVRMKSIMALDCQAQS